MMSVLGPDAVAEAGGIRLTQEANKKNAQHNYNEYGKYHSSGILQSLWKIWKSFLVPMHTDRSTSSSAGSWIWQPSYHEKNKIMENFVVSNDGVNIHYSISGIGRLALVCIHGWLGNEHWWNEQRKYFSKQYTVVCLELAGHGKLGKNRVDWTSSRYAEDILAVLEIVDADEFILIGHSQFLRGYYRVLKASLPQRFNDWKIVVNYVAMCKKQVKIFVKRRSLTLIQTYVELRYM